jgi:hypothetical protein
MVTVIPAEPGWYVLKAVMSTRGHGLMADARRVVAWEVSGKVVHPMTVGEQRPMRDVEVEYHPEWTRGRIVVVANPDSDRDWDEQQKELLTWALVKMESDAEDEAS